MIGVMERLWSKIDASGSCWEWLAYRENGYGKFRLNGKSCMAHRVVWETLVGPIPAGLQVDHLCRNRGCVNPDHLELVTQQENILRGQSACAWNARKNVCKRGHPLTDANLYVYPSGGRACRACDNWHHRAARIPRIPKGTP